MRKKTMLRLMILALAVALLLSGTVLAANEYTINTLQSDHTYQVYQIFTGDFHKDNSNQIILSNIKWGKNGTGTLGEDVSSEIITELTEATGSDTKKLEVISKYVDLASDPFGTVNSSESLQVPGGYYLIKDQDDSLVDANDSYTLYIVQVADNVTITPKAGVPTFNKKVQDADDTAGTTTGWQDSADHDIGDMVSFQLTGTVASNYDAYETYQFTFHDHQSDGLTFDPDSVVVKVGAQEIHSGYQVVTEGLEDGCTFEIVFDNLKDITSVQAGSVITVTYQSKLNDSAIIGSTGNPNTAHLEFSNNPNDEQEGETGKTPDDTVIVFTYKTVINKVDSNQTPLAGAAFKLEKFIEGEEGSDTYQEAKGTWTLVEDITAEEDKTSFTFSGLDDGVYRLTETTTPDGYNTIDPIIFTVSATHDETSDDPALQSLSGDAASGEITFNASKDDGELTSSVVNQSGLELPETGGMGTTIFYIVGGLLVVSAAVLLITKKRMSQKS